MLLVLSAIADAEGVEASDEEVEAEIDRARARYPENPKLHRLLRVARGRAYLKATLRRTEVVELLVDRWLEAHPEVGPLPHLEDSPEAMAAPAGFAVTPTTTITMDTTTRARCGRHGRRARAPGRDPRMTRARTPGRRAALRPPS